MSVLRACRRSLGTVRRSLQSATSNAHDVMRHRAIRRTPMSRGEPRVFYGRDHVPTRNEPAHGGMVKFQHLQDLFPNAARDFNVLYLGSSVLPQDSQQLLDLARRKGAAVAWNQNGVSYPGLSSGYEAANRGLRAGLVSADHVFFQSAFCKLSADRFLGAPSGTWEVLPNPVDTRQFTPGPSRDGGLVILLGGNQYQRYRYEAALRTLAIVRAERADARLLVTGAISWQPDRRLAWREGVELTRACGLADHVEFAGVYTQSEAPDLLRRADLLLHTKYNDPCPTIVLEAMACGLPVVYSASGGTPELVGDEAGIGVEAPLDFDRDHPPGPEALADAVLTVCGSLGDYAEAARRRAVARFDVRPWLARHAAVFRRLATRE